MLGALQSAFWEPAFLPKGGDALSKHMFLILWEVGEFEKVTILRPIYLNFEWGATSPLYHIIGAFEPTLSCQMSQSHWWARMTSLEISPFTLGTTSFTLLPLDPALLALVVATPITSITREEPLFDCGEKERERERVAKWNCLEKYHEVRRNSIWWWIKSASFETPSSCFFTTYLTYRKFSLSKCALRKSSSPSSTTSLNSSLNPHTQQYFVFGAVFK